MFNIVLDWGAESRFIRHDLRAPDPVVFDFKADRSGLLCVEEFSDNLALLGFTQSEIQQVDFRYSGSCVNRTQDPSCEAVARIEYDPVTSRFLVSGGIEYVISWA